MGLASGLTLHVDQIELFPSGAFGIADPARLGALGTMVVTALIALLYVFRRQPYILQWVVAWAALTGSLTLGGRDLGAALADTLGFGLARALSVGAIAAIALSATTFQDRRWPSRRYLLPLVPVLGWCVLSPLFLDPPQAVLPAYLVASALLVSGGLVYLGVLQRTQLLGTGVIGVAMLLAAVTQAWIGITLVRGTTATLPPELMVVNGLLFLFAALGMHLLVFEEMTFELRLANRRLQETQTELREMAITDALTGCHNRRFFHEVIGRELQRRQRYDLPLSILFVDIDHFKVVNDSLGHEAGDRLLEYVALFLRRNVREADYVFRWGGDEFLLLLSCSLDKAREKGVDLRRSFREALATSGLPTGVGLSVGCSDVETHDDDIMNRIREADETMYRNKQSAEARTESESPPNDAADRASIVE